MYFNHVKFLLILLFTQIEDNQREVEKRHNLTKKIKKSEGRI